MNKRQWLLKTPYIITGLVLCLMLSLVGGYEIYSREARSIRQTRYNELKAIADLKINQIIAWRQQRLADARMNASGFIRSSLIQWNAPPDIRSQETGQSGLTDYYRETEGFPGDESLKATMRSRMQTFRDLEGYEDVILADPDGSILLSVNSQVSDLEPAVREQVVRSAEIREAVFCDFHHDSARSRICLDVMAPVMGVQNRPLAVLILRSDPARFLYPLIQSWPLPSQSSETLMVRRNGDNVLFLNPTRFLPESSALSLQFPLTQTETPAVRIALGFEGYFEGKDYRGVEVMADLRKIPDSPWMMVAKVDSAEILSELATRRNTIIVFVSLITLLMTAMAAFIHHFHQKNLYREMFQSEQERRKIQEELGITLYSIGDGVISTDAAGKVRKMNPVAEQLTGWSEAEAFSQPLEKVFHIISEETRLAVENPVIRVIREKIVVGLANHTLLISRDGTSFPIADSGAPIHDQDGNVTGVVLVFRDQTAERRHMDALKESENRFRSLYESMAELVALHELVKDPSGMPVDYRILMCNPAFTKITGIPAEKTVGALASRIYGTDEPPYLDIYARVAETGESCSFDTHFAPMGKSFHISVFSPDRGKFGTVASDITERLQSEEKLASQQKMLNNLFENAPYVLVLVDQDGHVENINRSGELLAATPRELIVNLLAGEAFHCVHALEGAGCGKDKACKDCKIRSSFSHTFQTGESLYGEEGELTVLDSNSNPITLNLMIFTSLVKVEQTDKVLVTLTNVTRQRQTETELSVKQRELEELNHSLEQRIEDSIAELRRKDQALIAQSRLAAMGEMIGNIAHQWRQPLNTLGMLLYNIKEAYEFNELDREYLEKAFADGSRLVQKMSTTISDFSNFFRPDKEIVAFSAAKQINEAISLVEPSFRNNDLSIHFTAPQDLILLGFPNEYSQVLLNLLANAKDAILTHDNTAGWVDISLEERCGQGCLIICDSGPGIPDDMLEKIFEPYFSTKPQGTGIGLYMSKMIIERNMKGRITAENMECGARFTVYTPLADRSGHG